jgi:hypothetical protein
MSMCSRGPGRCPSWQWPGDPADQSSSRGTGHGSARSARGRSVPAALRRCHGTGSTATGCTPCGADHLDSRSDGPAHRPWGQVAPLDAESGELPGDDIGPLAEALSPGAHRAPGDGVVEASGAHRQRGVTRVGQDRRTDRCRAVPAAAEDEVGGQRVPGPIRRAAGPAYEDAVENARPGDRHRNLLPPDHPTAHPHRRCRTETVLNDPCRSAHSRRHGVMPVTPDKPSG